MPVNPDAHAAEREAERILREYDRRTSTTAPDWYDPSAPANLFRLQSRMRWSLALLSRGGLLPLQQKRILEVGCGDGLWLHELTNFGADPARLAGIDLNAERVARAHLRFAGTARPDIRQGDGTMLPWADGAFDLVLQSTVFSSILDRGVQERLASEMQRVCAVGGAILWYDLRVDNPRNRNVRGISASRLRWLFPASRIERHSICLAPPVARRLLPRAWPLAALLESLGVLNVGYVALIRSR